MGAARMDPSVRTVAAVETARAIDREDQDQVPPGEIIGLTGRTDGVTPGALAPGALTEALDALVSDLSGSADVHYANHCDRIAEAWAEATRSGPRDRTRHSGRWECGNGHRASHAPPDELCLKCGSELFWEYPAA